MYELTIRAETVEELEEKVAALGARRSVPDPVMPEVKATRRKPVEQIKTQDAPTPEPEQSQVAADQTDRELLEEVPPAPNTAKGVVDAGTGQPVGEAVKQMTMEDVRKSAAKLAVADSAKLVELLAKYGAPNLSGVPKDKLGDFAGDVMDALGE